MRFRRRTIAAVALPALAAGVLGAAVGAGTMAALAAVTQTGGSSVAAGTIHLTDDDAGASVVTLNAAGPGTVATGCLRVVAAGTLDATVRLYGTSAGALASHLSLTITRGTQASSAFPACTGFVADAADHIGAGPGVVYSGPLTAYPASAATGIVDPPSGSPEVWSPGEARAYRVAVSLAGAPAAQGTSASASLIWQGRST